ncbi:MAG: ORF6N domain-containing protein [Sulfuricurvum sp.]|nr:ORF6N domain-containing protein [Sulfuricurvum sp.]
MNNLKFDIPNHILYNASMNSDISILPIEHIRQKIYRIRNFEVMLDSDLAELYGVETRQINQAVTRNLSRFPSDFMFECSEEEWNFLRSQNVTLKTDGRGTHRKYVPKVFSEQGVYMLATVLKSQRAADVTIAIMRTFTKMRHYAIEYSDLAKQIHELRQEVMGNKEWTKERLSAVTDAVIMIEDSMGLLEETVLDIKSASEVEKIGFLRGEKDL